jgi:uncharacterized membrane protein
MTPAPPSTAEQNINSVARLEQEFLQQRTFIERMSDAIGAFVGTMACVLIHVTWFTAWILVNTGRIPRIHRFDPFPFLLLGMCVSLEAVILTTFVLMKQNRMSKRADRRDQLNLQIDLLAEKEVTKILQLLRQVCDHLGLQESADEPEAKELSENTAVEALARELKSKMPE